MFAQQTQDREIAISPEDLQLDATAKRILKDKAIPLMMKVTDTRGINKPILVLIHGIGGCKEVFKSLIDDLSAYYRVIAIDLPGHGESLSISKQEKLTEEEKALLSRQLYNLPALITQISLALKALNVKDSYSILGWSIGGHIAYGLAIKYPDLITCLITNGTPPINFSPQTLRDGFSSWFVDNIVKDWLENPKFYTQNEAEAIGISMGYTEVEGKDKYFVKSLMKADPLFRQYLYKTLADYQESPELCARKFIEENKKIPVCFLEGKEDKGIKVEYIRNCFQTHVSSKQPDSKYCDFDAGHSVFRKYPKEFNAAILNFLDTTARTKYDMRPK